MELKEKMIDLIQRNRISSTEVADALGKSGVLDGIDALTPGLFVAGEIKYIYGHNESNWSIHEQTVELKENVILYVDMIDCNNKAAFGDLVSKYLFLYKKVKGVVVKGLMRDNHTLFKEKYPIWCAGVTPLGCYNKKVELNEIQKQTIESNRERFDGGIFICDDTGCTVIEKSQITEEFYNKLKFIEMQEDIWFYCIDTLKWSTYETVCEKKYLTNSEVLPKYLQDNLQSINLDK